jgi:Paf1
MSAAKKRRGGPDQNDPLNMLRAIIKGFDIAYPDEVYRGPDTANNLRGLIPSQTETDAWRNPKNPVRPELKLLDSYPVLPDLEAFPDTGGYMLMKFTTNPVASTDTYDERLDVGLLRPLEPRPVISAAMQEARDLYAADPKKNPAPGPPPFDYEYFLPPDRKAVQGIKRKFNVNDSGKNSQELYTNTNPQTGERFFRFNRIRAYETAQVSGSAESKYGEVALALYDPDLEDGDRAIKKQKGAFYYPILQKSQIRPRRVANTSRMGAVAIKKEDEMYTDRVDYLDVIVRDPNAEEAMRRGEEKEKYDVAIDAS